MTRVVALIGAGVLCLAVGTASGASAQTAHVIAPQCGAVFGGKICIGGTAVGSDVRSITATIPLRVIQGAPPANPSAAMKWPPVPDLVMALPAEIRRGTGVDHFTFYWEPTGHPPKPFLTPHFDFHFYVANYAERMAMDCKNEKKADSLPPGYSLSDENIPGFGVLKGTCVPQMGMHALKDVDRKGTKPFRSTMVMGYYDKKPVFFEPMIARATLLQKKNFSLAVPAPVGLPPYVLYPRHFTATYDAASQGYKFEFTGFQ